MCALMQIHSWESNNKPAKKGTEDESKNQIAL